MQDDTIDKLISQWEILERTRPSVKLPNWWKRRKPSKRELPRLSIRTWYSHPDWYRMMDIYWMVSGWMHSLITTSKFPYTNDIVRNDALVVAWKLGEYLELLYDPDAKDFIEELQRLVYAIVESIDAD